MAKEPVEHGWDERYQKAAQEAGWDSWELWVSNIEAEKGHIICGSLPRHATEKKPCRNHPMANGRCRQHGGLTPVGPASPNWEHGQYSRLFPTLPQRLQESATRAYNDPDYLATRKEIALLEAREEELLGRLDTGESGAAWGQAALLVNALASCLAEDGDLGEIPSIVLQLQEQISRGNKDYALWGEVSRLMEDKRRLKETERRRLEAMQATMEAKAVIAIIQRLLGIMKKHLHDPTVLRNILLEVDREFVSRPKGVIGNGE